MLFGCFPARALALAPSSATRRVVELRPRTPAAHLEEFFSLWGAQPRCALAVHSITDEELAVLASAAAAVPAVASTVGPTRPGSAGRGPLSQQPRLQALAVCWDLRLAYFLELSGAVQLAYPQLFSSHACFLADCMPRASWTAVGPLSIPPARQFVWPDQKPRAFWPSAAANCSRKLQQGSSATVLDAVRAVLAQNTHKICYGALDALPELMHQGECCRNRSCAHGGASELLFKQNTSQLSLCKLHVSPAALLTPSHLPTRRCVQACSWEGSWRTRGWQRSFSGPVQRRKTLASST